MAESEARGRPRKLEAIEGIVLADAVQGGLVAGIVLIAAAMVTAAIGGRRVADPWIDASSIVLGSSALSGPATWGIFIVGFFVHFGLSAIYGAIWGAIANRLTPFARDSPVIHAVAGMTYGFLLWVINVRVIALIVYPWIAQEPALTPLVLHVAGYGLPLGLYVALRLRPVEKRREPVRV
ncbi:MAG TPA: hypothetical protein VGD74_13030 [Vulgatibacter sp.]